MPNLDDRAHRYAVELSALATQDADQIAARLQYGARAVAVNRFAEMWPEKTKNSPTRQALQGWYLYAFEQHLAEPVAGTVQTINGQEAGRALATVSQRTGAHRDAVLGVITALAHDARVLARGTAMGRGRLIEAGLNGRIATLFPTRPGAEIGVRQAIAEQWYARSFRAVIGPKVLAGPTAPVTPAETHAVGTCLAAGQARILHEHSEPIGLANQQRWREHASWLWVNQSPAGRQAWFRKHGYNVDLAMTAFGRLPPYLQSQLLQQDPPTDLDLNRPISAGTAREQAASMFDTQPVRPATESEMHAQRAIFTRGGGAIPPDMITQRPDARPLLQALRQLSLNNDRGQREVDGLGYLQHWWSDPAKLDQAVRMRLAGTEFRQIARHLGISEQALHTGLDQSANVDQDALERPWRDPDIERNIRLLKAQRGNVGKRNALTPSSRTSPRRTRRRSRQGDRESDGR